jgi:glycogen debranching enzyme
MKLGPEVLRDPRRAARLEWLHADGLGGHAASTVMGLHTRRAHGWLVTPTQPGGPAEVLLARFEEALEAGAERFELGVCAYPEDVLHPRGHERLTAFACGTLPTWTFECGAARLTRTLARVQGSSALVVSYLLEGPRPALLELRPMLAWRPVTELQREQAGLQITSQQRANVVSCECGAGGPALHVHVPAAAWHPDGFWYRHCEYAREREAGRPFQEDLWSPGRLRVELRPGRALGVLVWLGAQPASLDALALLEGERERQRALRLGSDGLVGQLRRAAAAFVVADPAGGPAVLGDYFEGRVDRPTSLIALPGLLLETRPLGAEARALAPGLLAGLTDSARAPEQALRAGWLLTRILVAPQPMAERDWRPSVWPAFAAALERCTAGYVGSGSLAANGLVLGPDARAEIDVQALWFNLLLAGAELLRNTRAASVAVSCTALAARLRDTVLRGLWCAERGHLADALTPTGPDFTLRPRQLLAISLPHALLPRDRAERVLHAVARDLLTPRGLRTRAPSAPGYLGTGDPALTPEDGRGSVWPELVYDYFEALLRVHGEQGRQAGRAWLRAFEPQLDEGLLGFVAAAFDGAAPHAPCGPPARAAAVAELLRLALRLGPLRASR